MTAEDELEGLRAICEKPQMMSEAGTSYIFLPRLRVTAAGTQRVLDALVCPGPHNGYTTRLFLSSPVSERGANWTQWHILGRTWHTWSWQNVPESLPPIQIVLEHLRALR